MSNEKAIETAISLLERDLRAETYQFGLPDPDDPIALIKTVAQGITLIDALCFEYKVFVPDDKVRDISPLSTALKFLKAIEDLNINIGRTSIPSEFNGSDRQEYDELSKYVHKVEINKFLWVWPGITDDRYCFDNKEQYKKLMQAIDEQLTRNFYIWKYH